MVDVVFHWINASDARVKSELHQAKLRWPADDSRDALKSMRFRSFGELECAIASLEAFAVGWRSIVLITSGETPAIDAISRIPVVVVPHRQFMPPGRLPTFSINTLHAHLHRLTHRLSDPFLLMDDDTFLTAPLDLQDPLVLGTNYLASEGARWPLRPLAKTTFARGVQNAQHALQRTWTIARQNVPAHTPQIVYHKTLYATAAMFWRETLATPRRAFRSLTETNTRVLWNAVDRKLGMITSTPTAATPVAAFVEMGLQPPGRLALELRHIQKTLLHKGVPRFVTINDCIDSRSPATIDGYATALNDFLRWLNQFYRNASMPRLEFVRDTPSGRG